MRLVVQRAAPPKLERQVQIRHPLGSAVDRRSAARRTAERAVVRALVALACLPVVAMAALDIFESRQSPTEQTHALVKRFAFEAFPQWATVHHMDACPADIAELALIIDHASIDPWGSRLDMRCGNGIRGAYIRSAGPDGRFDTADDISSNDSSD